VGETPLTVATDDLERAQAELARALGRARIGRTVLSQPGARAGRAPRPPPGGLLRMTRLHSPDNNAFNKPVEDLHHTLVQLHELLGSVTSWPSRTKCT